MVRKRRLPIGMQTFRELREQGCYYVDKTPYIERLLHEGKHYLLSRPRRFGKSLLLNTLKELFEGDGELFTGLYVHDRGEWSVRHPVVRLDFGSGHLGAAGAVHGSVMAQLAVQRRTGVISEYATAPERFEHLLEELHLQAGERVVVLVDEYDKPILDALETPEVARANRDFLRGLYGTIKSSACSTPTSRRWDTRSRWRNRAATGGWTWWRSWRRRGRRWRSCASGATRTSIGAGESRSI